MKKGKKGQLMNLQVLIMSIIAITVVIATGLYLLQEVQTSIEQSADSSYTAASDSVTAAGNATGTMIAKIAVAPTWIGLLIIVVFATAILAYFYMT